MAEINLRSVLSSVLLQVLAKHPGGMSIHDAYDAIDSEYEFPEDWYELIPKGGAYDELKALGYPDWTVLTESQLVQMVATEPRWQNEMRWARLWLQDQGYIDKTSGRGIWRLNSAGLKAAKGPSARHPSLPEAKAFQRTTPRPASRPSAGAVLAGSRPSPRDTLMAKLANLTAGMPLSDLDTLVEIARVIRSRSVSGETR